MWRRLLISIIFQKFVFYFYLNVHIPKGLLLYLKIREKLNSYFALLLICKMCVYKWHQTSTSIIGTSQKLVWRGKEHFIFLLLPYVILYFRYYPWTYYTFLYIFCAFYIFVTWRPKFYEDNSNFMTNTNNMSVFLNLLWYLIEYIISI